MDAETTISVHVNESLPSYDDLCFKNKNIKKENNKNLKITEEKDSKRPSQDRLPSYNSDLVVHHV
jgi:hypothetical protein